MIKLLAPSQLNSLGADPCKDVLFIVVTHVMDKQPIRLSNNFTINFKPSNPTTISIDLATAISTTLKQIQEDQHQPLTVDRGRSIYEALKNTNQQLKLHQLSILLHQTHQASNASTACPGLVRPISPQDHLLCHQTFTNSNQPQPSSPQEHIATNGPSIIAEMQLPLKARVESYEIKIEATDSQHCSALLYASSALGILRGLQTFSQLVYTLKPPQKPCSATDQKHVKQGPIGSAQPEDQIVRFIHGPLSIRDQPAFPYRGLLLDTSRNYYPIEYIQRTLRAMSWVKLNVFHWHIVDSQSWPIQIPSHPQLSQMGAYSQEETYSVEEIIELTRFANSRGIEILLEIDTPGHTAIIGEAYPDLIACKNKAPWIKYAAEPPAGQLRLADDRAITLINEIFEYLTTEIPGTLFSSGGDEVNKKCYEEDEPTQASLQAKDQTLSEALSSFVLKTHKTISRSGKVPVVWEEMVLDEEVPLPVDNTLVTVWRNSSMVSRVVEKGYSMIHGASDYSYLDCGLGDWLGDSINGTSWCDPFKVYLAKGMKYTPLIRIRTSRHLNGSKYLEARHYFGLSKPTNRTWTVSSGRILFFEAPRALSTAELYWTGTERVRSVTEALPRIHDMRYRLVQRGIRATPLQPHWCALRPDQCDLPPTSS
ncbi:beta-hexosaminidase [Puccinia sorghi]|uniref:Beta-hexosaminidase n=1 Tax=Puccinia sorghi TaxID=27349 RepID=A0A0L6UX78_9BASI|nr:beta-hexosaminidase [Puccinia sorghi]